MDKFKSQVSSLYSLFNPLTAGVVYKPYAKVMARRGCGI